MICMEKPMRLTVFALCAVLAAVPFDAFAQTGGFALPKKTTRPAPAVQTPTAQSPAIQPAQPVIQPAPDGNDDAQTTSGGFAKPVVAPRPALPPQPAAQPAIQPAPDGNDDAQTTSGGFAKPVVAPRPALPPQPAAQPVIQSAQPVQSAPSESPAAPPHAQSSAAPVRPSSPAPVSPASVSPAPEKQENLSPVEEWLAVKGRDLLQTLSAPSSKAKKQALIAIANEAVCTRELSTWGLGRYRSGFSQEQLARYADLFVPYFVASYGSIAFPFEKVVFHMGGVTPSKKDSIVRVEIDLGDGAQKAFEQAQQDDAAFEKPDGSIVEAFFAVRETNGYCISDVRAMGKSMVFVLRGMIERMMQKAQSDPEKFLQDMQSKIDADAKKLDMLEQFGTTGG